MGRPDPLNLEGDAIIDALRVGLIEEHAAREGKHAMWAGRWQRGWHLHGSSAYQQP